jgi:hypothetical protein
MKLRSKGFELETEIILESFRNKFKIEEVSVTVPKISKSKLRVIDMIKINKFFDQWVLNWIREENKSLGYKKYFFLISCSIGLILSKLFIFFYEK